MNHEHFMHHCIRLAQKGRGLVGTNPLVGSVLVRDQEIIAEGVYMGARKPHAERKLLEKLDQKISTEDVLYVNLEPCCHHGNTPPCTDIIIERGIQTVVIGMKDPDARVAGQGTKTLQDAGIKVIGPVLPDLCRRLNRGFVSLRENKRPYITLKRAQTKEGVTANIDGTKLCITSDAQNIWSHTYLRTTHDAILVGVQTVIVDNPELTIRHTPEVDILQPIKIILDPDLRIPHDAKLIDSNTIIITKEEAQPIGEALVVTVSIINDHFDFDALWKIVPSISSILVEGGQKTWDMFTDAGCIDEEVILIG